MQSPTQTEFILQPFCSEFTRDPYPVYAKMRDDCPIYYFRQWDAYLLSTYEDISTLVNDPRLLRSLDHLLSEDELAARRQKENWQDTPDLSRYVRVNLLDSEGEYHDRLRKLVYRIFTPARVHRLRGAVQDYVDKQIDSIIEKGNIDFIEDFSAKIPGHIIGLLLGVPEPDRARLRSWSENIVQFFEPERSTAQIKLAEKTTREFAEYLIALIEQRSNKPKEDLISELLIAESAGKLNRDELVSTCMLMLMAGHGSTIDVSGNGMLALLQHPDQMQKLCQQPELIKTAVQEMFRYDPPLPYFHRFISEDMTYKGQKFAQGTKIGVLYASANRDPLQFPEPDRFDVTREPNRHLAFGIGAHFCLGNHLARLNMDIMFSSMLRRIPGIQLATDHPEFRPGITSRGLKALPVCW